MGPVLRARRIPQPARSPRTWLLLAGATAVACVARAAVVRPGGVELRGIFLPACPLRSLVGLPCPFCGLTGGTARLLHGEWLLSWQSNVLAPLVGAGLVAVALYAVICRLAAGCAIELVHARSKRRVWMAALALTFLAWVVNLYRHFAAAAG